MKEGWKTNLLLKVCKVYQPQTIATSKLIPGAPYDVFGANGCIGKYDQYNHEEDEILLTCRGATCGNINRSTPKSWINGNAMVVHPISDNITKDFLMYALKSIDFSKVITGAAQPQITRVSLASVTIPIPLLSEQERIVSLLDAEFAKIDAIKANSEKQLQDAKALFQSALQDLSSPKEGWKYLPFEKSIVKVKKQKSIKSKDYKEEGQYPVVSQESSLISGYFDDASILYQHDTPVVIFGDHTQNVKYVDFDFIVGADGVHILSPIAEITPKFFYYQLKSIKLRNLGYARHYKLLKQESIFYPPLSEQQQIAEQLDKLSAKIQSLQSNFDTTVTLCNDLKQSILKDIFG